MSKQWTTGDSISYVFRILNIAIGNTDDNRPVEALARMASEELTSLRKILKSIEWIDKGSISKECPVCGAFEGGEHMPDCELAKQFNRDTI